jgi:hypothetical protein
MAPRLRAIEGGARPLRIGRTLVRATPPFRSPFPVDAVACEEDTFEVLSAEPQARLPLPHPLRVIHEANAAEPAPLGSVVVRGGYPLRLHAIVHDLSADPTCREEWVEAALAEVLATCTRLRLPSLALPLLGTRHGRLAPAAVAALVRYALLATGDLPARVWVPVDDGTETEVLAALRGPARA